MQNHPLEFRLELHSPRLNFVVVICFKDCTPSYLDVVACVAVLLIRKRYHKDSPTQYYAGLKTGVIFGRAIFVISFKTKCLQVVAGLVPLSERVHDLLLAPMNVKSAGVILDWAIIVIAFALHCLLIVFGLAPSSECAP